MFEIKKTKQYGRGVYATKDINAGEFVLEDHVLALNEKDYKVAKKTIIERYQYDWYDGGTAIALGTGSLFNHNTDPNIRYKKDRQAMKMVFHATKLIRAGEQMFIDYGYEP